MRLPRPSGASTTAAFIVQLEVYLHLYYALGYGEACKRGIGEGLCPKLRTVPEKPFGGLKDYGY